MSGCEWFLGATGEFCGAPVEAEGLILCAWHANCEDGNDSHRGPNQPTAQVSGWHPFMRQLGSNMCVCGAADSDPVHTSQAPGPTAMDPGGSEGMETAPPAVTIPEDQRWVWFWPQDPAASPTVTTRDEVESYLQPGEIPARLVTADEWDAITARLARLDAIEAAWEQWRTGTPGQVSMSSLFDALDGKP